MTTQNWIYLSAIAVFGCVLLPVAPATRSEPSVEPVLMYNWTALDWDWNGSGMTRAQWIASGNFIPNNCIIAGVKYYQVISCIPHFDYPFFFFVSRVRCAFLSCADRWLIVRATEYDIRHCAALA
jgi:hypothetical protein